MNINTVFPSKYLKADELPIETDMVVTIKEVVLEDLGNEAKKETKPIVYFRECEKGLPCNKTNANTIAGMYGPDTDGWIGKKVGLFPTEVDFQGKQTLAIRVRMRPPATKSAGPSDIGSAKASAWAKFTAANPGERESQVSSFKKKALNFFEGVEPSLLTAAQWNEFAAANFVRSVPSPISDTQVMDESEIPF